MRQFYSFLSVFLAATLAVPPLTAQTPLPPADTAAKTPTLQVRLQESDAAALPVNTTSFKGYTVQVLDANGAPLVGAAVALRMPDDGPSGSFADGNKASVAYTDSKGIVRFQNIHWNGAAGTATVHVTVVKGAIKAGALIQQSLIAIPNGTALASAKPASNPPASMPAPSASAASAPPSNNASSAGTAVASAKTSAAPPSPAGAPSQGTVVAPFGPSGTAPAAVAASQTPPPATQSAAAAPAPPVPGTPVSPTTSVTHSGATSAALQTPSQTASTAPPSVSVTDTSSTGGTAAHAGISKKWILLAVVAAGAGVGAALAMSGHGSTPTAAAAGLTIGSPTLSVGH